MNLEDHDYQHEEPGLIDKIKSDREFIGILTGFWVANQLYQKIWELPTYVYDFPQPF